MGSPGDRVRATLLVTGGLSALGDPDQISQCERQPLALAFAESGYNVNALVLAVVTSPGFTARKN